MLSLRLALVVAAVVLASPSLGHAAPKKPPSADKAATPPATSLELVTLDEMQLGKAPPAKAAPEKKRNVVTAPKDSLDGLLNHSTRSEPAPDTAAKQRMKFPGDKEKAAAAPPPEKTEVVVPARVTSEITAKAIAASANANKEGKSQPSSATVPKLPPKMKVGDDPLAGIPDKGSAKAGRSKKQAEL